MAKQMAERQAELTLMEQERKQMAELTAKRAAVERREGLWQHGLLDGAGDVELAVDACLLDAHLMEASLVACEAPYDVEQHEQG